MGRGPRRRRRRNKVHWRTLAKIGKRVPKATERKMLHRRTYRAWKQILPQSGRELASREKDSEEEEERALVFAPITVIDKDKSLPYYSAIVNRTGEELMIGIEDLDKLQLELEMMLSSVVIQRRTLNSELEIFMTAEENKPKKSAHLKVAKLKNMKGASTGDETSCLSDNVETFSEVLKQEVMSPSPTKNRTTLPNRSETQEHKGESPKQLKKIPRKSSKRIVPLVPPSIVPIARNDMANKFWGMVEYYCADITQDDIKFLEDVIGSYDVYEKSKLLTIPPLGTHYKQQWSDADSKKEQKESTSSQSGPSMSSQIDEKMESSDEETEEEEEEEESGALVNDIPGPYVKKIVDALISENNPTSASLKGIKREPDDNEENIEKKFAKNIKKELESSGFISNNLELDQFMKYYKKLPKFHTSFCFERKVRQELQRSGLVDGPKENSDDEVLDEIMLCKKELEKVSYRNKEILNSVLKQAKHQYKRQLVKNEIKRVDNDITDISLKENSMKVKLKTLCKKDVVLAWSKLKERDKLLQQLNNT